MRLPGGQLCSSLGHFPSGLVKVHGNGVFSFICSFLIATPQPFQGFLVVLEWWLRLRNVVLAGYI